MNSYRPNTVTALGLDQPPFPDAKPDALAVQTKPHACSLKEEKPMDEKDFLGRNFDWIQSDFGRWRVAAENVPFAAEVREVDCRQDLHSVAVALECVQRRTLAMRRLLKPDSESWVRMVRHRTSGAGEILAQVSFFGGDPWPFAVVTTTEHGQAQSHLSIAIPYANRAAAGTEIPKGAPCFLTNSRMVAIARCAKDSGNYRLYSHSLGFTFALESGRKNSDRYPVATYNLHRLLIREMLGWAFRRHQHLQERAAA
jgi:hypothetical protein